MKLNRVCLFSSFDFCTNQVFCAPGAEDQFSKIKKGPLSNKGALLCNILLLYNYCTSF